MKVRIESIDTLAGDLHVFVADIAACTGDCVADALRAELARSSEIDIEQTCAHVLVSWHAFGQEGGAFLVRDTGEEVFVTGFAFPAGEGAELGPVVPRLTVTHA